MFLGDLGAEVVKVEQPGVGDDTRGWGPPFAGGESAYFLCTNRNKKSLTVDFKSAEGIALVRKLAERADVLIENFRPGAMARMGLGEKELREAIQGWSMRPSRDSAPMVRWPTYRAMI